MDCKQVGRTRGNQTSSSANVSIARARLLIIYLFEYEVRHIFLPRVTDAKSTGIFIFLDLY